MWAFLKKLCNDCLTENDGKSFDPFRVGGAALTLPSIGVFLWGAVVSTLHDGHMDFIGFAAGFGGIAAGMTALAAGVSVKARTDQIGNPNSPSPPTGTP